MDELLHAADAGRELPDDVNDAKSAAGLVRLEDVEPLEPGHWACAYKAKGMKEPSIGTELRSFMKR
ncbi:MAG: hypothetical protein ABW194_00920, partial [Novosphingobium sp.]